jgi:hypothetical protein
MNAYSISVLTWTLCALLMTAYLRWRYSRQRLHRYLALHFAGIFCWGVFMGGLSWMPNAEDASNWVRYAAILPIFNLFLYFVFARVLTRTEHLRWPLWLAAAVFIPFTIWVLGNWLGLLQTPVEARAAMRWVIVHDAKFIGLYALPMTVLGCTEIGLLVYRWMRPSSAMERQQIGIILLAGTTAFFSSFLAIWPATTPIAALAGLFYLVPVLFSLTRRRMLDVHFLVKEGAVAALAGLVLSVVVAAVVLGLFRAYGARAEWAAFIAAAFLFAFVHPLLSGWTRRTLGRWMGEKVDVQKRLLSYLPQNSSHTSFEGQIRSTLDRLVAEHGLARALLLLPDRGGILELFAASPAHEEIQSLDASSPLGMALVGLPWGADLDTLSWTNRYEKSPTAGALDGEVRDFLTHARCQACFPLVVRGSLRGVLMVGAPVSGRPFYTEEMDFFAALAGFLAGIVENSALQGQMMHVDRLSTLGMLAAGVTHEIRNPLSAISVFVQMLPEKSGNKEFMEKFQRLIPAELDKLNRLTEDLMNLARPATRAPKVVDLGALCQRERQLLVHQYRKRQVELVYAGEDGILIEGIDSEISQVFLNLLLNALDVSSTGTKVEVALAAKEGAALLTVRDHGAGIAPAAMKRLFEPFFTTKEQGHGLGLATSRRIVESFGGTLTAVNAPDGGAEFQVAFPLASVDEYFKNGDKVQTRV